MIKDIKLKMLSWIRAGGSEGISRGIFMAAYLVESSPVLETNTV